MPQPDHPRPPDAAKLPRAEEIRVTPVASTPLWLQVVLRRLIPLTILAGVGFTCFAAGWKDGAALCAAIITVAVVIWLFAEGE